MVIKAIKAFIETEQETELARLIFENTETKTFYLYDFRFEYTTDNSPETTFYDYTITETLKV